MKSTDGMRVTLTSSQVFTLYKIEILRIDGRMSFPKRQSIVDRFYQDGSPRVLVFSSVGTAGLNLAIADTVILLVRKLTSFRHYHTEMSSLGSTLERTG